MNELTAIRMALVDSGDIVAPRIEGVDPIMGAGSKRLEQHSIAIRVMRRTNATIDATAAIKRAMESEIGLRLLETSEIESAAGRWWVCLGL